jgi:hypothetical protein
VSDTLRVRRPWIAPHAAWWLVGIAVCAAPSIGMWRDGELAHWIALMAFAPVLYCGSLSSSVLPAAELEITGPDLRFRSAPWRHWTHLPVRGVRLIVRPDWSTKGNRNRCAVLAVHADGDPVRLIIVEDQATADDLKRLLEDELGLGIPASAPPPYFALGPLLDALAPEADEG